MKHFFFKRAVLILFVLTASVLWGQPSRVTAFNVGNPIEKTIVREYCSGSPVTISYVETTTEHFFAYNDGYQVLSMVNIDTDYSVNDFVLINDELYFCGETPSEGFLGKFGINDFFFVNYHYEVTTSSLLTYLSQVQTLNRLVVFDNATGRNVVAIGRSMTGQACIAEVQNVMASSSLNYRVGELPTTSYDDLLDLTQTQDFVVAAGYRPNVTQMVCIRLFNKYDVFSGLQDSSFGFYHDTCHFDSSQLIVSPVHSNIFLVSSYWRYQSADSISSIYKGTAIGYYNIVNSTNTYVNHNMTLTVSQPYLNGGWKLRGMTQPRTTADAFFLLQDAEVGNLSNPVSMVFDLGPTVFGSYITPILITMSYTQDAHYQSIDSYGIASQYIMNGLHDIANTRLTFCENIAGQFPCLQDSVLNATKKFNLPDRHFTDSFMPAGGTVSFHVMKGTLKDRETGVIECN